MRKAIKFSRQESQGSKNLTNVWKACVVYQKLVIIIMGMAFVENLFAKRLALIKIV